MTKPVAVKILYGNQSKDFQRNSNNENKSEGRDLKLCARCGQPREDLHLLFCRKCRKDDVKMMLRVKKLPIPWRWR